MRVHRYFPSKQTHHSCRLTTDLICPKTTSKYYDDRMSKEEHSVVRRYTFVNKGKSYELKISILTKEVKYGTDGIVKEGTVPSKI